MDTVGGCPRRLPPPSFRPAAPLPLAFSFSSPSRPSTCAVACIAISASTACNTLSSTEGATRRSRLLSRGSTSATQLSAPPMSERDERPAASWTAPLLSSATLIHCMNRSNVERTITLETSGAVNGVEESGAHERAPACSSRIAPMTAPFPLGAPEDAVVDAPGGGVSSSLYHPGLAPGTSISRTASSRRVGTGSLADGGGTLRRAAVTYCR